MGVKFKKLKVRNTAVDIPTTVIYYQREKGGEIHKAFLSGYFNYPDAAQIDDFCKTLGNISRAWV